MLETRIDQKNLLEDILLKTPDLDQEALFFSAWASAYTVKSPYLSDLIEKLLGVPSQQQQKEILFAVARMGVTNPYFVSRQHLNLTTEATLEALNFRPLNQINLSNEIAYHYACVAISVINAGHVCLRSHVATLQKAGATDQNIDTILRLAAVCHSLAKLEFSFAEI